MQKTITVLLAIILIVVFQACQQQQVKAPINISNMNKDIGPGDDFYLFVNQGWLENNPIPEEYSRYGSFEKLAQENDDKLYSLLTEIRNDKGATPGTNRQRIRDFYNSAMDTINQTQLGLQPIEFIVSKIEALNSKEDIPELTAWLHQHRVGPLFGLFAAQDRKNTEMMIANISQGGLGMSDRDYYLNDDSRSKEIRENYELYIEKVFILSGYSRQEAQQARQAIMNIETRLADASMTRLERRDPHATYNKLRVHELQSETPSFSWDAYFAARNIDIESLNVSQPDFFVEINALVQEVDLEAWKKYFTWNSIRSLSSYLGKDFDEARFAFYGTVMTGSEKQQERWKRALRSLNYSMGEAVGQEYVAAYFPPESKERMVDLVEHLRVAFDQRIGGLSWMSEETKVHAYQKLESMNVKIGYPDKWTDYSELEIKDQPFVLNILAARQFNTKRNLEKIGQAVDRDEWFMSPQTVNAYYSPTMNEIVFPAAILQPPFFFPHGDDAVNFGAIGMVIGHEMTHGFDDTGRRYAADGNLRDWWTEEDSERFEELSEILIEQYNKYTMLDTLTINGRLSLGENIADLGGLTIAYNALQNKLEEDGRPELIDGFTPEQRFFIAYAQIWRNHMRDQRLMQQINEGPHSPGEARVNGIVYNMQSFYDAFGIDENTSSRFIAPENRSEIW